MFPAFTRIDEDREIVVDIVLIGSGWLSRDFNAACRPHIMAGCGAHNSLNETWLQGFVALVTREVLKTARWLHSKLTNMFPFLHLTGVERPREIARGLVQAYDTMDVTVVEV